MNHGFVKVASAIPGVRPGNCAYNAARIISLLQKAEAEHAEIVCFPELCITGYTCQDLFESTLLLESAESALFEVCRATQQLQAVAIVGVPVVAGSVLMNCAAVLHKGEIVGIVPKTYLPNYKEFYEKRWFASAADVALDEVKLCGRNVPMGANMIFKAGSTKFAIEICEDLWAPVPRSAKLALAGAEIIFNLSADNELVGKNEYLNSIIAEQSARTLSAYVYSSCGFGESTQDLVFAGNALVYENGRRLAASERFCFDEQLVCSETDLQLLRHERRMNTTFGSCAARETRGEKFTTVSIGAYSPQPLESLTRSISPAPFRPTATDMDERCREIIGIQVEGLAKRFVHTHAKTLVIGVSGGLDSTLALMICAYTFDKLGIDHKNIIGVTMPGFGTSRGTRTNAIDLMEQLGVTMREVPINSACEQHFSDIGHDASVHDVTYENSQARERTQILMDISNQTNGLVVGTGDLSELALGWATYNGDHMSMYGVNASIPKTLIQHLIRWIADRSESEAQSRTLMNVVNTPISPELIPTDDNGEITQKTEDAVGPYELHDFFIYYALRYGFGPKKIYFLAQNAFAGAYDAAVIKHWLTTFFRRFFMQQFKRSCLPDGPKVGSCSLSPRGDWRMPSDADATAWLRECETL